MRKKLIIHGGARILLGYHSRAAFLQFTLLLAPMRALLAPSEQTFFDAHPEHQLGLIYALAGIEAAEGLPFKLPLRSDQSAEKLLAAWRHYVSDQTGLWSLLIDGLDEIARDHG